MANSGSSAMPLRRSCNAKPAAASAAAASQVTPRLDVRREFVASQTATALPKASNSELAMRWLPLACVVLSQSHDVGNMSSRAMTKRPPSAADAAAKCANARDAVSIGVAAAITQAIKGRA